MTPYNKPAISDNKIIFCSSRDPKILKVGDPFISPPEINGKVILPISPSTIGDAVELAYS